MPRKYPHYSKTNPRVFRFWFRFAVFFTICISIYMLIRQLDKKIMPIALALTDVQITSRINSAINEAVTSVTSEMDLTTIDFYQKTVDQDGKILSLSVNTLLVNEFCGRVSVALSQRLEQEQREKISLPLGTLLGIDILANMGPRYTLSLFPAGNALVDYESTFESVGINQIHFQIWLTVDSSMKIINPLQEAEMSVNRKVALINTVISGEVPPTYFQGIPFTTGIPAQ